jgi:HK97 family phage major capsid protein
MLTADRLRCTTTTRPIADVPLPAIDETSRADGSRFGGVLACWSAEAQSINSTYPRWRRVGFSDNKMIGIGYATSEIMADGDLFEADLRDAFRQELAFALDHCVLVGSGAGQPERTSSPALSNRCSTCERWRSPFRPRQIGRSR